MDLQGTDPYAWQRGSWRSGWWRSLEIWGSGLGTFWDPMRWMNLGPVIHMSDKEMWRTLFWDKMGKCVILLYATENGLKIIFINFIICGYEPASNNSLGNLEKNFWIQNPNERCLGNVTSSKSIWMLKISLCWFWIIWQWSFHTRFKLTCQSVQQVAPLWTVDFWKAVCFPLTGCTSETPLSHRVIMRVTCGHFLLIPVSTGLEPPRDVTNPNVSENTALASLRRTCQRGRKTDCSSLRVLGSP